MTAFCFISQVFSFLFLRMRIILKVHDEICIIIKFTFFVVLILNVCKEQPWKLVKHLLYYIQIHIYTDKGKSGTRFQVILCIDSVLGTHKYAQRGFG